MTRIEASEVQRRHCGSLEIARPCELDAGCYQRERSRSLCFAFDPLEVSADSNG
jgi:hypothetical protein